MRIWISLFLTSLVSASELPRELVAASSTAETGELHFKADSISSTTATTFRIYYNGQYHHRQSAFTLPIIEHLRRHWSRDELW